MVKIITDSMSDITVQEAAQWGLTLLPLHVRFGAEEYDDGVTITREAFYDRLMSAQELPKTSQVSPQAFRDAFERALEEGDEALCITGSGKLSGTYQSAVAAREEMKDRAARVQLVDSGSASLGQALLVLLALGMKGAGQSAGQIARELEQRKQRQRLVGFAGELKYLVMGGRLSALGGKVGTALHILPLLRMTGGRLEQTGVCRGAGKARNWLLEQLAACPADTNAPLILAGAHAPEAVALLKTELQKTGLALPPVLTMEVGAVIGSHTGPGLVAMTWLAAQ